MAGISLPNNPGSVPSGHVVHPTKFFIPSEASPFNAKAAAKVSNEIEAAYDGLLHRPGKVAAIHNEKLTQG